MKTFSFLLIFAFFYSANSYKILFYNPKFGISHVTFTGKIADTLAAAGHDVVVYQPVLNENITFTGSKHKSVRYYTMPKNYSFAPHFTLESSQGQIWEEDSYSKMKKMMVLMTGVRAGFCELVLNDKENMDKLREENFDLGITELFESCGLGVFRKLGIKKYITTFGSSLFPSSSALLGIKLHPSYIPGMMLKSTDEMTFIDRVMNIGYYILESYTVATMFTGGTEAVVKKEFPDFTINDAIADSAFYFVNSDEHVDYPQAITHKVIYMAGLGKVQAHPLDKEYIDIFDSAKKGVILFSFGSVVQSSFMKPELKQAFLEAFAEFPDINFLWKYEKDEHQIAKGYKNVFTGKWLPQNDILDHPKLLAFISHGGMNSIMEGSSKGVPMICIPIFADQKRNSFLLQRRGTAIKIDKSEINKENIVAAIKEIINNDKYRKNAKMLSKMVNLKPFSSAERVVKYAEFAAEFGDTGTLQTQGRYQSFIVLYSLDVIFFLITVFSLVIGILIWAAAIVATITRIGLKSTYFLSCKLLSQGYLTVFSSQTLKPLIGQISALSSFCDTEMACSSTAPTLGRRKMPHWEPYSSAEAPQLKIYNSLTRRKDLFRPIDGNQVKFYICGPTVYDSAHMGHARAYLSFDIVRRVLSQYFNYDVTYVMNITDIDDKIIKRARQNFLFDEYQEKNKGDFYTVGKDVMAALKEFREKVEVETDPDKKKMLSEMLAKVNAVATSIEKRLEEKILSPSNMENETLDLLANAKDIISEFLDKRFGSTVNDHSIFAKLAKKFENEFMQDMDLLNVMPPHILTRVSEYVPEIIEYVEKILNNGYAYVTNDGSVYFDSTKFQSNPKHFYAKLVPEAFNDTENQSKHMKESEGELSISDDRLQEKKNNSDFALWKTSKAGEPFWDSPWGKGRPGWHIECSAMSTAICGNKLDIHAGGFDLKFPHHDNEIAQCEAYFDDGHWVNYFLHCGTLRIAGSKMSKSLKNFISIKLALKQYSARQVRILFLMHSWSDALDYSPQTMDHACYFEKVSKEFFLLVKDLIRKKKESDGQEASSYKKFDDEAIQLFNKFNASKTVIHEALCDSFDTRKVIETIRNILTESNTYITTTEATGTINADLLFTIAQYITRMLRIFGVIPEGNEIGYPTDASGECGNKEELLMPYLSALAAFRENVRNMARTAKNSDILKECDVIRDDVLPKLGVRLEDRANQTTLKLEDPEVLEKERLEKIQKELEKKQQKENARLQAEANKKAKEEKKKQQEMQKKKKQEEQKQPS